MILLITCAEISIACAAERSAILQMENLDLPTEEILVEEIEEMGLKSMTCKLYDDSVMMMIDSDDFSSQTKYGNIWGDSQADVLPADSGELQLVVEAESSSVYVFCTS